ncbi:MAG: RDD family protein [Micromonosporaceae bacterium]
MSYVPGSPSEAIQQPQAQVGEDVLGRRISAALIDLGLLTVLFIVLGLTIGESKMEDGTASVNLNGLQVLLFVVLVLLYYFAFEAAIGQTIGKLILGLRVVRVDGGRPSMAAIATRTLLRIIDGLPLLYLVGFIMVMATGERRQRLGDVVAQTKVVRN